MSKIRVAEKGISYLLWKAPKGKVNPKALGWTRPDGVINFQTSQAAENYAKNRCVSALQGAKPFERGVLVKENQVLAEINGDCTKADLIPYSDKMIGADLYHGHPSIGSVEFPLSLSDYIVLISQRLNKIVAFNKNGEHSTLINNKKNGFFIKLLPKKWQERIMQLEQIGMGSIATSQYAKEYAKMFPQEIQKKAEQALHAKIGVSYGDISKIEEFKKTKFTQDEIEILNAVERQLTADGTFAKNINNFWKKFAEKLDCIYETNYTNFVKKV